MTHRDDEETIESLVEHPHPPRGMQIKLDRGFTEGKYGVCIEFGELAGLVGFTEARRQALAYTRLLRHHLEASGGLILDETQDASLDHGRQQKFDLETTFLTFGLTPNDGIWHDIYVTATFRHALLRADQQWDQHQAGWIDQQRDRGRERFRHRLDTLLKGKPYQHIDDVTKERLRSEVTALLFPPKGRERW